MSAELAGSRHVVVGAASDIGEAISARLLDAGAEVIGIDRHPPRTPVTRYLDVDLPATWSIDDAVMRLDGMYDGLTCVADAPAAARPEEVLAVNALAVRYTCEALYERLNQGSCVTIVASTAAIDWAAHLADIDDLLAADGINGGLAWFANRRHECDARTFASEVVTVYAMAMGLTLATLGLRINVLLRGPIAAPEDPYTDGVTELGARVLSPCGIADPVIMLNSPAARWINGHCLVVDGGGTGGVLTGVIGAPPIPGRVALAKR